MGVTVEVALGGAPEGSGTAVEVGEIVDVDDGVSDGVGSAVAPVVAVAVVLETPRGTSTPRLPKYGSRTQSGMVPPDIASSRAPEKTRSERI